VTGAAPSPIAPIPAASTAPARIFSFFCIAMAQCREIQRLPLDFTKFMDGREQQEAVLCEQSGGGIPYEVEV
jgi:formate hydrogenlyase subunit 4